MDQDDVEGIKDISASTQVIADDDDETHTIESIIVDIKIEEPVEQHERSLFLHRLVI